ncbi:MAG TPA: YbjN domain-containing protein [Stellaceae bacterium]|nr:YbjN domain-containing protein [Stellaceae bacterium]
MTALSTTQDAEHIGTSPIDLIEEIVEANEWPHDRSSDDEILIEVAGRWCDYRLLFVWQADLAVLHFTASFDMKVPKGRRTAVNELLATANERMWLGHFDVCAETSLPMFRHALLLRGTAGIAVEQIEDLVETALSECERFYPAFQLVIWGGKQPDEAIATAMIDPMGEA